ncbi:hypothetical protein EZS27_042617 [termite gut metagenome]|uniref:Uncharacterized protein n=1 Tax=termite gut metagenome TaxID=433724 RepID=A0A5J4P9W7_9ZZZZ
MSKRVDTSGLNVGFIIGQADRSNREANSDPTPLPPIVQEETVQLEPEPAPVIVAEPVREPEAPKEESKRRDNRRKNRNPLNLRLRSQK